MTTGLRIRNLTNQSIGIVLVERGESTRTPAKRNLTSFWASSPQDDPVFTKETTSLTIAPWTTSATDFAIPGPSSILRLTFAIAGSQHSLYIPFTLSTASRERLAFTPYATERFAIYHSSSSHLAILSSPSSSKTWMTSLPSSLHLSSLSIPGTHNSAAFHPLAPPSVQCQSVDINTQLSSGIRFFDVRLSAPSLRLVHGFFPVSLISVPYLPSFLHVLRTFLSENPGETVILSLKREGPGRGKTDADLVSALPKDYDDIFLHCCPTGGGGGHLPTLGEARGKIVVLRRFADVRQTMGIDATEWPYSLPHFENGTGSLSVQDFCDVDSVAKVQEKVKYALEQLERASSAEEGMRGRLCLNYLSAACFWRYACWPLGVAERINPPVIKGLCVDHGKTGDGCTGVVIADFVGRGGDWDLVDCVLAWNAKLLEKSVA